MTTIEDIERDLEQVMDQFYEDIERQKTNTKNPERIAELGKVVGRFEMKCEEVQDRLEDAKRRKKIRERLIRLRDSDRRYEWMIEESEAIVEIAESGDEIDQILDSLA